MAGQKQAGKYNATVTADLSWIRREAERIQAVRVNQMAKQPDGTFSSAQYSKALGVGKTAANKAIRNGIERGDIIAAGHIHALTAGSQVARCVPLYRFKEGGR